jgi:hypothetical protein
MYTAIRALVLCDEVKVARSGKVSLVGLANDPLEAGTCPGVAWTCPVLLLEADGRPSAGIARFVCDGLDFETPIRTPGDLRITVVAPKLLIPILKVGDLVVTVVSTGEPGAPTLEARWGLGFSDDVQLRPGTEEVILTQAKRVADAMRVDAKAQL